MYRTDKQFMKNPATANCRIYVGGIPTTVVADDLEQKFRFHGKILGLVLQKGFAFIQFESENQAKDAIAKEHGAFLHGKKLNVRPALRPDQMNKGPMNQNQQKPQQNQPPPQQPQQQQQKAPPAPSPQNNSPQKKPLLNEPPPAPHHDEPEPQEEGPPPPHIDFTEDESNQEECNVPPPDIRPPQMQHQPPPNQHNNRKNQFNNNRDNYQDNAPDPPFMGDDGGRKWGNGGGRGGRRGGRSRDRQHNFNNRLDNRENAPPPFYPQEDNYHHHYIAPPPLISRPERNDCEIIVVAKHLTQYAEYVESRLKAINLLVDLLFPNEDVPIGKVLANISSRGCLYAILVMPQNEEHKSVTLNILHGIPQEHRNMPIEDALLLMKANFNAYMRGERVGVANPCDGNMSLMDKHPQSVQMFLNILTENRHLTSPQYDKLIKYLQDKRQLQHEFEKNEGIEIESADPDNKQAELQSRIMNILNNQGTNENESIETLSLTNTNVAPPVTPSDGGDGPTPLLKDPTVQKALDSIMLGDMFKNMAG